MEEGMGLLAVSFWRRNYFGKKKIIGEISKKQILD
jgi:hypothetical protein